MVVLILHTHQYSFFNGLHYSSGGFVHDGNAHRYLREGVKLIVVARVKTVNKINTEKYSLLSNSSIQVVNLAYGLPMFFKIWKLVQVSDAVIARIPSFFGILAALSARMQGKPILTEVVGNAFWPLWYSGLRGKVIAPFMVIGTRLAARASSISSYITDYYIQSLYPAGRMVGGIANVSIPDDVIRSLHSVVSDRVRSFEQAGAERVIQIGMIGGYEVDYKGHDVLLLAMKRLVMNGYSVSLQLVGGGNPAKLHSFSAELGLQNVVFKGPMSNKDVLQWMSELDVYVQPSRTEAHGRSIIEAMASGCVVVSSDIGGMRETVNEKCRFRNEDDLGLSRILIRLMDDLTFRREMTIHSATVAPMFSEAIIEEKRRNVIDEFYALE
jgi:glycosyltransferase involved in cell wall biosynthesis